MSDFDKDIESQIVRYLDGALNSDEEVELERKVLRDPEARRLLQEYRRVDELASTALAAAVAEGERPGNPLELSQSHSAPRGIRFNRAWWLLPSAIAAALLFAVTVRSPNGSPPDGSLGKVRQVAIPQIPLNNAMDSQPGFQASRRRSIPAMRRIRRDTVRDVFGVVGDDGNIYWIETDRTRTIKGRQRKAEIQRAIGDL